MHPRLSFGWAGSIVLIYLLDISKFGIITIGEEQNVRVRGRSSGGEYFLYNWDFFVDSNDIQFN